MFTQTGIYTFCTWAVDTAGQESGKKCIDVHVVSKQSCEFIGLDDTEKVNALALRITSKRLHMDTDGLVGYPVQCCKEYGFCEDLKIDSITCEKIAGDLPDDGYAVVQWDPNSGPIGDALAGYKYPQILCIAVSGGLSYVGVIDNNKYRAVGNVENPEENMLTYWLMGESEKETQGQYAELGESGSDRYFFAEQLQQEENETKVSVIVDSVKYSDTVNKLMEQECMEKDLESEECQFDCNPPEYIKCNPTAPCGSGNCLGCPKKPPCECCPECHKLMSYEECTYRKYEQMYGRPQVDYMFCWKIDGLKDTPWCYQKSDQPTSTVNFPWYGFTRKDDGYYRSLSSIGAEYVDEIHEWNANVEVREKPAAGTISQKEWVPEVYCHHNFDPKLFRNIWAKIFTATPFLNDLRNNLTWTRTGPGKLYAGGGFRREPACWWQCCAKCAPFCDCACVTGCGGQLCCLMPRFNPPSVTNVIKVELPFTKVSESSIDITYNDDKTIATVDNGAFNIISTGNMPFEVSASFSKDESAGEYTMVLVYNPIGGFSGNKNHRADYDQFVIAQDIIFSYDLNEDAEYFLPAINESFATRLVDQKCKCTPKLPSGICPDPSCGEGPDCCCCPCCAETITTAESVKDQQGTEMVLDTIKIEALRTAAYGFVDTAIARGINVGLVAFSQNVMWESPSCPGGICSSHPLTTDAASLRDQIRLYSPLYGTCIACGIDKGIELLSGASGEKHMIVMSDGVPQCCLTQGGDSCPGRSQEIGKSESLAQATRAKGAGITVHTVALGTSGDLDLDFMENLAKEGGGKYYHVTCECGLECIYRELSQIVNGNAILVSDTTGSMREPHSLNCPPEGTPVIHKFGAINISITGNIDNYMDKDITTGVRSKGNIKVDVNPDIVNRFVFNLGESSIDYYSLFYPVKHEASRKEFSYGKWLPGYPYAIGEPYLYEPSEAKRSYTFDDSYGYESAKFDYPEQCRNICPADCTCPAEDITDVTCTDKEGNSYKRKDCVCLPAKGHSYETPCTSTRTFHEEEGYYFDFVDLETKEVASDINLMGQTGTNPQFTGSLRGDVSHTLKEKGEETQYQCQESAPEDWSLTENTILLPTDPQDAGAGDSQREPLAVHGLAWRLADCASQPGLYGFSDADNIKIGRAMGPLDISGIKYNAGPYILTASTDPKKVVEKVVAKYPEFKNVDYNALGAKAVSLKVNPIMPAKVCIMDGAFDQPTQLFNEMHVPYIPWSKDCLKNADVLVFGCPSGPLGEATVDEVRSFVSNCGTYVATDQAYGALDQIFPGYVKGDPEGSGSATLWEGTAKGSYDLPDDLRRFFQTPYETLSGWTLMGGTVVISGVNSDTKVLAKGDYSSGQTDKPMAVTFNYGQRGRVFYYPVHLEGAAQVNQKAFMSSFYASAGSTSRNPAGTDKTSAYELTFEAMNFPYSLIKYESEGWDAAVRGDDCSQFCGRGGMYAAPVCLSPVDASTKGCVYCKKATADADVYAGCAAKCGPEYTEQRCCCAIPSFTTKDAKMTLYIHFRDNAADQTFNLFPARQENKPYAIVNIDVAVRDPSRLTCEAKPASTGPRQEVTVDVSLTDPLTGGPISSEEVTINVEAYGVSQKVVTDANGEAQYKFGIGEQSTKISCAYGSDKTSHTESYASAYVNVSSIDRFWWFLSPEVLLLLIVLILLAYSYRWFRVSGKK